MFDLVNGIFHRAGLASFFDMNSRRARRIDQRLDRNRLEIFIWRSPDRNFFPSLGL